MFVKGFPSAPAKAQRELPNGLDTGNPNPPVPGITDPVGRIYPVGSGIATGKPASMMDGSITRDPART